MLGHKNDTSLSENSVALCQNTGQTIGPCTKDMVCHNYPLPRVHGTSGKAIGLYACCRHCHRYENLQFG